MKKTIKFFALFLFIFGISLSNIPFYAFSGLIDSYAQGKNIDEIMEMLAEGQVPPTCAAQVSTKEIPTLKSLALGIGSAQPAHLDQV